MAGDRKIYFTLIYINVFTLLQRLDVTTGQSDPNAVNGHLGLHGSLASILVCLQFNKQTKNTRIKDALLLRMQHLAMY